MEHFQDEIPSKKLEREPLIFSLPDNTLIYSLRALKEDFVQLLFPYLQSIWITIYQIGKIN